MSVFGAFLGNNAFQEEASSAEKSLRSRNPLLLHANERIELAFADRGGKSRDKSFLTSHRLLVQDVKGATGKRQNFKSLPYAAVEAFSIETAGSADGDIELKLFERGKAFPVKLEFSKKAVDVFAIQQFLNVKIVARHNFHGTADPDPTPLPPHGKNSNSFSGFMDYLGANAAALDPSAVETQLKTATPVLLADEHVELAFKHGRDCLVITSKRLLSIDVRGMTGKRIEFLTILWASISGFSVETAGSFLDGDCETTVFTRMLGLQKLTQDLRKSSTDIFAVQKAICNRVLGADAAPLPNINRLDGHADPTTSWLGRENARPLDAAEMNRALHAAPTPVLQGSERCELAFKGRRNVTVFTTKRLLVIDPKGWSGKRVEYLSIPWASVLAFEVETAGKTFDTDAELKVWTDMMFDPGDGTEDNPPTPYMSMLEVDFNKKLCDMTIVGRYLSSRCLQPAPGVPIAPSVLMASPPDGGLEGFISKLGHDQRAIDAGELDKKLHTSPRLLLDDENAVMAFQAGKDLTVFTTRRVFLIDFQTMSKTKVKYTSVPYSSICAFSAESAGGWDRDSQVYFHTRNLWDMRTFALDFRKGKADIVVIQKFLSAMVLGSHDDAANYLNNLGTTPTAANPVTMATFLSYVTENSVKEDAHATEEHLRSEMPVLVTDEHVEHCFRTGRDMFVFTTARVLFIDVQGLRGKKLLYLSIPLRVVTGFAVETAGRMDKDAEVYLYFDVPAKPTLQLDILVKRGDVMDMNKYLTEKLMF